MATVAEAKDAAKAEADTNMAAVDEYRRTGEVTSDVSTSPVKQVTPDYAAHTLASAPTGDAYLLAGALRRAPQ